MALVYAVMFVPVLVIVAVWLGLVWRLLRLLRTRHPETCAELRRPAPVLPCDVGAAWRRTSLLLGFVLGGAAVRLGDRALLRHVYLMRAWFVLALLALAAFTLLALVPVRG